MSRSGAVQSRAAVAAALLAAAALAWWFTAVRMAGMDAAPGTDLGTVGWFAASWAVMMAAMMLPSLAPAAVAASAAHRHTPGRTVLFAGGYLLIWTLAGIAAYAILGIAKHTAGLAWASGGRWLSAGVLILAAVYELTPVKRAALTRCRRPRNSFSGRGGRSGTIDAIVGGIGAGVWCLACSWALMAALFALGVMSLVWMGVIGAVVTLEKTVPRPRLAIAGAATLLTLLAIAILLAPHEIPGLVVPGSSSPEHGMRAMGTP